MLQEMRKYSKSWVSSLFLGVLALSFVVWGIADIFKGNTDSTVATVGSTKIAYETFQREYQNFIRNQGQQTGQMITPELARALGLGPQTLQRMISRAAVDNVVTKLGLTASDTNVSTQIKGIRGFAGPLGTFDHASFVHAITESGFTEQGFIDAIRADTSRDQLLDSTKSGMQIPPGYAQALFDFLNEERAVQYVELPADKVVVANPDDATLAAYVKANGARFSTPEYRQLTYVAMTPADVMNQVSVTDDQLKSEFEIRKASYEVPEKRDVEQITFPDEASAKAASAEIEGGKKFSDIAAERKLKPSDIALGTVVKADLGADRGPAAFALPADGVSKPVKGLFGYVLLHVTRITPGVSKTFDDMKETLRKDVMLQLAMAKLTDVTNAFEDARGGGANLVEAAKKVGMKSFHVVAVDANGLAPDGSRADLPNEPEFLPQVFKGEIGEEGDPFQSKDGNVYVLRVDGVTPPKVKSLDSVRAAATTQWLAEQRAKLLAAKAKALTAEANKDQSLAGVAQALGTATQASGILTRGGAADPMPKELVAQIFNAPPGAAVNGPSAKGDAYIIARVTGIAHPPSLPFGDPRYQQFLSQLGDQLGDDIPNSFAIAARNKQGVTINQQMVDRVTGGGT
jgi:peptidyl-prolyl cis-trans isomerase D